MRPLSASLAIAALSLLPSLASAAPASLPSPSLAPESTLLAQYQPPPGWWEQSGRPDDLRQRYWELGPRERYRYNQLEAQIRDLQARQEQLRREQRRILRWGD
jgi:Spy/CpxP family protein refolding chaperone